MDSSTISGRIARGVIAGTIAAAAGLGLVACQSAPVTTEPEPAAYEDSLVEQERIEQAADRMREKYAGRPADRIDEAIAREDRTIKEVLALHAGQPADRLEEAIARALQR